MNVARLTAASVHHRRDGERPEALEDCALLADTANFLSSDGHVRRTCTLFLYVVHVRCTSWLVRCIVVK